MYAEVVNIESQIDWDMELDVLIIGAGACGLAAAIAAHDKGKDVGIIEKRDAPGGNTSLSTGSVPGAGSKYQKELGIEDSPARMIADLNKIAGQNDLPGLLHQMASISAELVHWLIEVVQVPLVLITDYKHVGHSVPRLHAPHSRRGQDLVDSMVLAVERRGIPLAVNNPAQTLFVKDGKVVGVETGGKNVIPTRIGADAIILASNGFAADPVLVQKYCAEIADAEYFGALGSEGEAIRWGDKLNAQLANMASYQGYAAVAYPHGSLLSWTTIEMGGILVNERGERFGNEDLGYSEFAHYVLDNERVYAIFDDEIKAIASLEEEFQELVDHSGIRGFDNTADLANFIGCTAEELNSTLTAYAQAAKGNREDLFGRKSFGLSPLKGKLWVCRVTPGLFHTQGGLAVDSHARVLDVQGNVIPGLYAGGGAAAGISGYQGAAGYASGNGLLTAIGLGYLAGNHAGEL